MSRTKTWPAAWLLLAILVFAFQPLVASLFCHQDTSHDHSSHPVASAEHHSHSDETLTHDAHFPEHSDELCCCQVESTPVVAAVATTFTAPTEKSAIPLPLFAVISQVVLLEVAPAIQSRAGPPIPSVVSQLRRSSLLNRAPPLSA